MPSGLDWEPVVTSLREDSSDAIALANADLLDAVRSDWEGEVVAGTSLRTLTFTRPGDSDPSEAVLSVSHDGRFNEFGGHFIFQLQRAGHRLGKLGQLPPDEAPDYLASLLSRLACGDFESD